MVRRTSLDALAGAAAETVPTVEVNRTCLTHLLINQFLSPLLRVQVLIGYLNVRLSPMALTHWRCPPPGTGPAPRAAAQPSDDRRA